MDMIRVNSSALIAVGYRSETGQMRIQFQQGRSYDFVGVPLHIYDGLMRATSKGAYYNDHIRDRYQA